CPASGGPQSTTIPRSRRTTVRRLTKREFALPHSRRTTVGRQPRFRRTTVHHYPSLQADHSPPSSRA
ncbi:MAG: hypothetical protein ACUVR2_09760, partial [Anaerolineae bacterium]